MSMHDDRLPCAEAYLGVSSPAELPALLQRSGIRYFGRPILAPVVHKGLRTLVGQLRGRDQQEKKQADVELEQGSDRYSPQNSTLHEAVAQLPRRNELQGTESAVSGPAHTPFSMHGHGYGDRENDGVLESETGKILSSLLEERLNVTQRRPERSPRRISLPSSPLQRKSRRPVTAASPLSTGHHVQKSLTPSRIPKPTHPRQAFQLAQNDSHDINAARAHRIRRNEPPSLNSSADTVTTVVGPASMATPRTMKGGKTDDGKALSAVDLPLPALERYPPVKMDFSLLADADESQHSDRGKMAPQADGLAPRASTLTPLAASSNRSQDISVRTGSYNSVLENSTWQKPAQNRASPTHHDLDYDDNAEDEEEDFITVDGDDENGSAEGDSRSSGHSSGDGTTGPPQPLRFDADADLAISYHEEGRGDDDAASFIVSSFHSRLEDILSQYSALGKAPGSLIHG